MPRKSPYNIELHDDEAAELQRRARRYTLPYFQVLRAQMILLAADGWRNDQIAEQLNCRREVVAKWRKRFFERRLAGLDDRDRPGRPRVFPPEVVVQVKALACELPSTHGVPLARWSQAELARYVQETGLVGTISGSTIWRWLSKDAIRPWQHRSWLFPRDPRLRTEGRTRPRSVPAVLARPTPPRRRVRHFGRREDEHPGASPYPCLRTYPPPSRHARRTRISTLRCLGLPRSSRRTPRPRGRTL